MNLTQNINIFWSDASIPLHSPNKVSQIGELSGHWESVWQVAIRSFKFTDDMNKLIWLELDCKYILSNFSKTNQRIDNVYLSIYLYMYCHQRHKKVYSLGIASLSRILSNENVIIRLWSIKIPYSFTQRAIY